MRQALLASFVFALSACVVPGTGDDTETEDDDDGGTVATDGGTEDTWDGCEETWVEYVGEDDPAVGDEWTVWLYCDDVLLMGPMVIRFDPLDFATVQDNVVTWERTGTGTMFVQTGAQRAELEVTVEE